MLGVAGVHPLTNHDDLPVDVLSKVHTLDYFEIKANIEALHIHKIQEHKSLSSKQFGTDNDRNDKCIFNLHIVISILLQR